MAEGNGAIYNNFKEGLLNAAFDLTNDTVRLMLVTGYTPNIDAAHSTLAEVLASAGCAEVTNASGTGYTANGEAVANQAVAQDDTNDRASFDFDDVTWSAVTLAEVPSHAILYDDTHATNDVICYWELGRATNGGDYTIQLNASGAILLT